LLALGFLFLTPFSSLAKIRGEQDFKVAVPPVLRNHITEMFLAVVQRVYPSADKEWVQGVVTARFQKEEYDVRGIGSGCQLDDWSQAAGEVGTLIELPKGFLMVGSGGTLPGEHPVEDRERPLTIDEGKPIAEAVFERLRDMMVLGKDMKFGGQSAPLPPLPPSKPKNTWIYSWGAADKLGFGAGITVEVRARDGRVIRVKLDSSWQEMMGDPKITREQALEKAKALPDRLDGKYLSLSAVYYYAERRLVWQYMPPPPAMLDKYHYGIWDAMTGDLLESDCLNGAKPQYKLYLNPEFFFEPTEANVKANLEKNLKKWAEELEAKQKAAGQPVNAKPPEGK
jgi:hypothetical protein